MFTGLIEEIGILRKKEATAKGTRLEVEASKVLQGSQMGDSIAVNGVCLTVVKLSGNSFTAEAVAETVSHTTVPQWRVGDRLNLERALALGSRMGGHWVQGHVDGTGVITKLLKHEDEIRITVNCGKEIMRYIIYKGSIAVDGISLTVAERLEDAFAVALIPHTWENTNLKGKKVGDKVNLETDLIAKYVEQFLSKNQPESGLSEETLRRAGF